MQNSTFSVPEFGSCQPQALQNSANSPSDNNYCSSDSRVRPPPLHLQTGWPASAQLADLSHCYRRDMTRNNDAVNNNNILYSSSCAFDKNYCFDKNTPQTGVDNENQHSHNFYDDFNTLSAYQRGQCGVDNMSYSTTPCAIYRTCSSGSSSTSSPATNRRNSQISVTKTSTSTDEDMSSNPTTPNLPVTPDINTCSSNTNASSNSNIFNFDTNDDAFQYAEDVLDLDIDLDLDDDVFCKDIPVSAAGSLQCEYMNAIPSSSFSGPHNTTTTNPPTNQGIATHSNMTGSVFYSGHAHNDNRVNGISPVRNSVLSEVPTNSSTANTFPEKVQFKSPYLPKRVYPSDGYSTTTHHSCPDSNVSVSQCNATIDGNNNDSHTNNNNNGVKLSDSNTHMSTSLPSLLSDLLNTIGESQHCNRDKSSPCNKRNPKDVKPPNICRGGKRNKNASPKSISTEVDDVKDSENSAASYLSAALDALASTSSDIIEDAPPALLHAAAEAFRSGQVTPLLKQELKWVIQLRRLSQGKDEMEVTFDPPSVAQMSEAEQTRAERRRKQNRIAARKFRQKRKSVEDQLLQTIQSLKETNSNLTQKAEQLRAEKQALMEFIAEHLIVCPFMSDLPQLEHLGISEDAVP